MKTQNSYREPSAAGSFYIAKKKDLEETIMKMIEGSNSEAIEGQILGIISPHAGYTYSGQIAADVYKQIQSKKFDNVIVISPSHFEEFSGCSVFFGDYITPLGIIPTNKELANSIVSSSPHISESQSGHRYEHALEVQLPFLQLVLDSFKLVPIVMGQQDYSTAEDLSSAIWTALSNPAFKNQKSLIVGSSDLSHYLPIEEAKERDSVVLQDIQDFNAKKLSDDINSNKCQACGFGPILSTMLISKKLGATQSKVISYGTSGDVSKDYNNVVGYLSAVFYTESANADR
ncbi:AmmeMemoRadiSam system protein B, partial [bacterium]|nr:AmmeMemoRadiSam system protein B [bacterium]